MNVLFFVAIVPPDIVILLVLLCFVVSNNIDLSKIDSNDTNKMPRMTIITNCLLRLHQNRLRRRLTSYLFAAVVPFSMTTVAS